MSSPIDDATLAAWIRQAFQVVGAWSPAPDAWPRLAARLAPARRAARGDGSPPAPHRSRSASTKRKAASRDRSDPA